MKNLAVEGGAKSIQVPNHPFSPTHFKVTYRIYKSYEIPIKIDTDTLQDLKR